MNLDIVSDGMKLAVFTLTLLLLVLIQYVNRFMIRRRQKEFAVQTIMGMEQRVTAWLFFGETLIMGLCSLVLGILAGAVCSQFITAMLMNAFGKEYRFTWLLFPDTIGITVVFFLLCFVLTGFFQVRIIRKIKIIDMLKAQRKNEEKVTKSNGFTFWQESILRCRQGLPHMESDRCIIILTVGIPGFCMWFTGAVSLFREPVSFCGWCGFSKGRKGIS